MNKINDREWFPSLGNAIETGEIRAVGTKREALETAAQFGWGRRVLMVERRFERVYVVGTVDFQPQREGDLEFQTIRMPLLRWERGEDGIKYQPVVTLRKPYNQE